MPNMAASINKWAKGWVSVPKNLRPINGKKENNIKPDDKILKGLNWKYLPPIYERIILYSPP